VKPASFYYHAPSSAGETVALLAELGEEAKVIAGGQSLVPLMALRLTAFEHLVDLRRVVGLSDVERHDGTIRIGARTTQATIERSAQIAAAVPLLARATPLIGHFQIRNRGTIGGSIAHADAAAEYPAVALALGARMETLSPRGHRSIPASEFFTGPWTTALAADELLTGLTFPVWSGRCGFAVEEFAARAGDFAIAGAAVAVELETGEPNTGEPDTGEPDTGEPDAGARIRRCGIGLFGLGPAAQRAAAAESALTGAHVAGITAADLGDSVASALESVPSDLHAPASYRKRVGAAMVAAAWQRAVREASSG
jgi:aerobic carbon-monoxide dehydrogenase medium subunit